MSLDKLILRLCLELEKYENREEKGEEKGKERKFWKIKIRFKLNKLIIYVYSNSFDLFLSII